MFKKFLLCLSLVYSSLVFAQVKVATIFSHNMVLQREVRFPVWGTADPGETVTVSFAGQTVSATASSDGKWIVYLEPMSASNENRPLVITGKSDTITINNCLVGEVWLCSGQSNMQMPMWSNNPRWRAENGDQDVAAGANPQIRIVEMHRAWSAAIQTDVPVTWSILDERNGLNFSATAFYFGQALFKALDVPIGLVASHWGGTMIEPWTPPVGFDSVPQLRGIAARVNAKLPGTPEYEASTRQASEIFTAWLAEFNAARAAGLAVPPPPSYPAELVPPANQQQPTVLYNHMIHPLVPFRFRGVIWYQGCSNLHDGLLYRHKMQALLNGWRQVFNNPEMPFYFVQLAPFRYGGSPYRLPVIWEAQSIFARENDHVGMAVINDVGDAGDIHPRDKRTVGNRLALLALRHTYGQDVKADAPELSSWKIEDGKFILEFKNVGSWRGTPDHFEIAGASGSWVKAQVVVDGTKLIVSSPDVSAPTQMRYLWNHTLAGVLFSEAGLPLGAFRCGKTVTKEDVLNDVYSTSSLIYHYNMKTPANADGTINYSIDNSAAARGKVKRITYVVELTTNEGEEQWAIISMDAFTTDAAKIGVPVHSTGVRLGVRVHNLTVFSNVPGVVTGEIPEGNIEFWGCSYVTANNSRIPGASADIYDFGDTMSSTGIAGYGSMQIHNFSAKQVIFAYNNFRNRTSDIGIGNAPGRHKDWTFAANSHSYSRAVLRIFAEFE